DCSRILISFISIFVGQLLAEKTFSFSVEFLGVGNRSTQVLAKAIHDDAVCVIVHACFAKHRYSSINVPVSKSLTLHAVNQGHSVGLVPGKMPECFQHDELCPQQRARP
ncbi:thioesterase family protein, partial [Pseudoalteromonas sp. S1688]